MQFHEAVNSLLELHRYAPRPGTDATRAVLSALGDPHEELTAVQIAGSNGKGSTVRMVESVLREAGLDVGRYTSPHLSDLRERITINGRKISAESVVTFLEQTDQYLTETAVDGDSPTFFEAMTALALWEFGRQDVDVAVLEAGIGGPLDATSAVDPVASAITGVSLEHTAVLGDDIETIARDMAGIEPADRPLVTGATGNAVEAIEDETEQSVVVAATTDQQQSASADIHTTYHGREGLEGTLSIAMPDRTIDTALPLVGSHQARNAGVAAGVLAELTAGTDLEPLDTETVSRGFRNAHWPGRFEIMNREPLVVLDGAHNPEGAATVSETLAEFEYDSLSVVVGVLAEKDLRAMAATLSKADHVVACEPDKQRAEDSDVIARAFREETDATVEICPDVSTALVNELDSAGPDDCLLVTGSLYTVAEAREHWTQTALRKRAETGEQATSILSGANVPADATTGDADTIHRVLKTRVTPRQAQTLRAELLAAGGSCAVSGLTAKSGEKREIVLAGTLSQFSRLLEQTTTVDLSPSLKGAIRRSLGFEDRVTDQRTRTTQYPWTENTAVMGILNVTPDSFHDGGEYNEQSAAVARARSMIESGADIIDVGGESTRPGAEPVSIEEEKRRVVPVIEELADLDVLVSIDTRKAAVARAALEAGADILNDVSGLADPSMRLLAGEYDVPVVVMHSIDAPVDPGNDIHYDDVVEDVIDELTERVLLAKKAGLDRSQIIVDPGLGFGKTAAESFELLDRIEELQALGCPVLVGHSHKSMFELVDRDAQSRYEPTIAATTLAAERGVDIVRVHDVEANAAAVDVVVATESDGE